MLKIFPPTFVFSTKVSKHQKIKEQYYPKILIDEKENGESYKKNSSWYCKVSSSFFAEDPQRNFLLFDSEFLKEVVWDNFRSFFKEMCTIVDDYPLPQKSNINEIWYNIYQKGEYQDMHSHLGPFHGSCNFSGIYLMHLEEPNKTTFRQEGIIPGHNSFIYEYFTDSLEEGTLLLFPSSLLHLVKPCENRRVTVSFNITCRY